MPEYDFRCQDCRKKFTLRMAVTEKEQTKVHCPKCGSRKVIQQFGSFFAKTSRKS